MVTFAVTLSDLIEKGGAYAGLAAFFGLAILSILYFAQAREIRRLREWAGRAPERAQELEQRVIEQAEVARRVKAVPSRRPGEPATAAALAASKPPPAPAPAVPGAEAPTTQQPSVETEAEPEGAEEEKEVAPEPATAAAAPAETDAAEPEAKPETPAEEAAPEEEGSPTEHPVVAASAPAPPEEAEDETKKVPAAATALAAGVTTSPPPSNGAPPEGPPALPPRATQSPPVRRPAPAAPLRSSTSATRRPPPRGPVGPPPRDGGDNRRTPVIAAAAIAGVVLVVVGAIALIGGGGDEPEPAADSTQPAQTAEAAPTTEPGSGVDEKQPPTISRAETNVAVLNGTAIDGLASRKNEEIEQAGYTISQDPTNYTDQARSASIVFYNGSENRAQAFEVAKLLQISDRQPIIDAAAQLAPGADVVVVLGSDQG